MRNFLKKIDFQRIAGINRILGIDLYAGGARIVELEKKGSFFNRFSANYKVVQFFTHSFGELKTSSDVGPEFQKVLTQHNIKARFVVSSIRSSGVKTVVTTIPADNKNIDKWIQSRYEKLLNMPLSLAALSYAYEILEEKEGGFVIEITFIHKKDIERHVTILQNAGLSLLALGFGTRDAINTLFIDHKAMYHKEFTVAYITGDSVELTRCKGPNRIATKHVAVESKEELEVLLSGEYNQDSPIFVFTEKLVGGFSSKNICFIEPLGISSGYALALGLAIKGFIPELSPANFLPEKEQQDKDSIFYRLLFQRAVLMMGCLLLLLLVIPATTSFYYMSGIEEAANVTLSQGEISVKAVTMEREIAVLKRRVQGAASSVKPSTYARTLHDIAAVAPGELWLYKLSVQELNDSDARFIISGYTQNNDNIPRFLKSLEKIDGCSEVNLVKAGLPGTTEPIAFVQQRFMPVVTFEIRGTVKQ